MRKIPDRYWVGGTATWNATAGTKWSTTSGGAGGASAPGTADDVYFDAASGSGLVKFGTSICKSLNFTGFTGTLQHDSAGSTLTIHGGLTISAGMTMNVTSGSFVFASTTDGPGGAGWNITTNGKTLPSVTFNGTAGVAKWTLQDALTSSGTVTFTNGTFDSDSQAITAVSFTIGTGTKTLTLGSSVITLSGFNSMIVLNASGSANLTVTANTASFVLNGANSGATPYGVNWNGASISFTGSGACGFDNSAGTWANLTRTGTATTTDSFIIKTVGPIVTGTLTITGNSATNRVLCYSATLGTPMIITAAATSLTDVDFMDIAIVGPTGSTITSDSFDRADGALGTTDAADGGSALAWTANNGTWSIDTNKAASTSTGLVYRSATVDVGVTDMAVEAVVTPGTQIWGLNARFTDQNNRIWAQHNGTQFAIGQIKDGTQTTVFAANISFTAGDKVRVVVMGNGVAAYKNDVYIGSAVITYTLTGTGAGLTTYGTDLARRFDDFKVLNAPNVTGTRLGDCLGNSGIEFTTARTLYGVGSGNVNASDSVWSLTSNGSSGESPPLPQDSVVLDSYSATRYTINYSRFCKNLDMTDYNGTLQTGSSLCNLFGDLSFGSNQAISGSSGLILSGAGNLTLNSCVISLPISTLRATTNLLDDLVSSHSLVVGNLSVFNSNNNNLTLRSLSTSTGALSKTINLGTSTVNITSTVAATGVGIHTFETYVNAENATINFVNASTADRLFKSGFGNMYGTVNYTVSNSPGGLVFNDSSSFNEINIGAGRSLKLTSGTTQQIGTLNINATPRGGVRLPGVSGTYLSTPDSAAISITGDIDIRVLCVLSDWTPSATTYFINKQVGASTSNCSYEFFVLTNGVFYFGTSNGTTYANASSIYANGITDNTTAWVRAVRRSSDGRVEFFKASGAITNPQSSDWTQVGSTGTLANNPYDNTASLFIGGTVNGSGPLTIYRTQIRNNVLDDGTGIVFDTDFSNQFGPHYVDSSTNGAIVTPITTLANVGDGRVVVESTTANSPATLQVDNVTNMNYVDLRDVVMNGADTYIGATSVIRSNVKGVRRGPQTGMSMMGV